MKLVDKLLGVKAASDRDQTLRERLSVPYSSSPPMSDRDRQRFTGLAIMFSAPVKHGRLHFSPSVPIAFEDPDARPYFLNAGWAVPTDRPPEQLFPKEMIDIDPMAIHADGQNKGKLVLGEEGAAEALSRRRQK